MIVPATSYALKCDGCEMTLGETRLTISRVKDAARQRGWVRFLRQDLCPRCQIAAPKEKPVADPRLEGGYRCLVRPAAIVPVPDGCGPALLPGERGGAAAAAAEPNPFHDSPAFARVYTHQRLAFRWAQTTPFRWKEKACPIAFMTRLRSKLGALTGRSD